MYADHSDGEYCMEEYGNQDHAVYGALDESQNERPSAIEVSCVVILAQLISTDLRGFLREEFFIGYDVVLICLSLPGTGVRGPGLTTADGSNLIFATYSGGARKEVPSKDGVIH